MAYRNEGRGDYEEYERYGRGSRSGHRDQDTGMHDEWRGGAYGSGRGWDRERAWGDAGGAHRGFGGYQGGYGRGGSHDYDPQRFGGYADAGGPGRGWEGGMSGSRGYEGREYSDFDREAPGYGRGWRGSQREAPGEWGARGGFRPEGSSREYGGYEGGSRGFRGRGDYGDRDFEDEGGGFGYQGGWSGRGSPGEGGRMESRGTEWGRGIADGYGRAGGYGRQGGWGGSGRSSRDWGDQDELWHGGEWRGSSGAWQGRRSETSDAFGAGATSGWSDVQDTRGMRQRSYVGRGPRNYRRNDERIMDEINERLTHHPDIDAEDVDVRVQDGVVTLEGQVEDKHAKRLAEDIAEEVFGVREIHNQLRVRRGLMSRLFGSGEEEESSDRGDREVRRTTTREGSSGAAGSAGTATGTGATGAASGMPASGGTTTGREGPETRR